MKVIVIGAGIGGSALALALERVGLDFVVLEQAEAFGDVGAGIQLSPNGVRILEWLGLGDDLASYGTQPDSHNFVSWDTGEVVLRTPLMPRAQQRFGSAYFHAHRRDLIDSLTKRLDPSRVRLGTQVTAIGQNADGVWAECADGSRVNGDVLIGADGIHSVVREQVFRPDSPRPSGYVTWRGVIDTERIAALDIPVSSYVVMGPRLSFVFYYVAGGRQLNWLALGQTEDQKRESWSQTATKEEVLAAFEGWYDIPRKLIEETDDAFVTALYDRVPLDRWVDGRIAVMGDAAHAMLPYHAQGAVQSIEDAWVLARSLQTCDGDAASALKTFETLRHERATRMVQHSRNAQGWYHVDDPADVAARNDRFRNIGERAGDDFTPQQIWLYSYDAEKAVLGTDDDWRSLPDW